MLDHTYAVLEIKTVDAAARSFSGLATTPDVDLGGDSVDPFGVRAKSRIPLFLYHDRTRPVGHATFGAATAAGIPFTAWIPTVTEPGILRDRCNEAWQSIQTGLASAVSIGWRALANGIEFLNNGVRRLKAIEVHELSIETLPMNPHAVINAIKSLQESHMNPTISERIQGLEQKRATVAQSMLDLLETHPEPTPEQTQQHDAWSLEAKGLESQIARWRDTEKQLVATASVIPARMASSPYAHVSVKPNVAPGTQFVRYVCAQLACKQLGASPWEYAQRWNDSTPEVALALKAAVAAGTATDATWAGPLVQPNISKDFIELLRAATIVDRIPGLFTVPFNTKFPQQTGGGTYNWVGEAKPKPVSALAFASLTLDWAKIAGIIVLTQELVKLSNPKAEEVVRREMIAGIARFKDAQFTDPAVAAVAGVNPASITNGAPTAAATVNPLADILSLIAHFTTNNIPVDGLTFIMSPANALALSFKTYTDGSPQFAGIGINGGTWKGMSVIVSNTVTTKVIALQPQLIAYADDGGVTIDASTEASLQMDSAPMSPADATTVYVSMFQNNCVALRAEQFSNWKKINANAVKYLTAAAWPAPTGVVLQDGDA